MPGIDIENRDVSLPYLLRNNLIDTNEPVILKTLSGGVSNRAVLVSNGSRSFVLKQALSKLRVQTDWFSDPRRVHIEALGLHWLEKLTPPGTITPLLFEDRDEHIIAMAAVPQPHENWKAMLMTQKPNSEHVVQFASILASIHKQSSEERDTLACVFSDRSFFETLRLEPYYRFSAQQVPESSSFFNSLLRDTLNTRCALVHGDFSPKNILVHQNRLVLLDHEVIHYGDPGFDVGFSLTHLLSKAHHVFEHRKEFIEAAYMYSRQYLTGIDGCDWKVNVEARSVRHTLGCLLARVAGRSPLEYLTEPERTTQHRIVLKIMQRPPKTLSDLIAEFSEGLHCPK